MDICGEYTALPVISLPNGAKICFFNLHGNVKLTERCAAALAERVADCDVLLTAESKGLQLTHCVARELGHDFYAVARKSKKLYIQDGIEVEIESSITTGKAQKLYLSAGDAELLRGKKSGHYRRRHLHGQQSVRPGKNRGTRRRCHTQKGLRPCGRRR